MSKSKQTANYHMMSIVCSFSGELKSRFSLLKIQATTRYQATEKGRLENYNLSQILICHLNPTIPMVLNNISCFHFISHST